MKKREIKSLKLNKKSISIIRSNSINGAGGSFRTIVNCEGGTFSKHLFHTCETCL